MNKVNVKRFIPLLISLFALCFALSWIGAAPKARAEGETEPSEPEGGLPAGAIVAITAGSVAGAAAIAAAICFAVRKRKQ